jgi:hypothetical protein
MHPSESASSLPASSPTSERALKVGRYALGLALLALVAWSLLAPIDEGIPASGAVTVDTKRKGARDLDLRLADMERDGVDAELVFPSLGLMLPRIADREGQREACKIWNDWAWDYTAPVRNKLIPAAMIPCS